MRNLLLHLVYYKIYNNKNLKKFSFLNMIKESKPIIVVSFTLLENHPVFDSAQWYFVIEFTLFVRGKHSNERKPTILNI